MADLIFVAVTIAFFGSCVLYVRGLDHIVREGEEEMTPAEAPEPEVDPERAAA